MEQGKIVRLTDRGFGFIEADADDYDDDLFFHANEIQGAEFDNLSEGSKVEFEITETPKGLNAVNVSVVEGDDDEADEAPEAPEADDEDEDDGVLA